MSWLKAAAKSSLGKAAAAIKTVVAVVEGTDLPDDRLPPEQRLREHLASLRAFADTAEAAASKKADEWDRIAAGARVAESLEGIAKVLEGENGFAENPGAITCTMLFVEDNGMGVLLRLSALLQCASVQRAVLRTVVRLLRLRYELLDTGSVAHTVLRIAWHVQRAPLRPACAAAHCEMLAALCEKARLPPWPDNPTL